MSSAITAATWRQAVIAWLGWYPDGLPGAKECDGLGPPGSPGAWPVESFEGHKAVETDGFQRPGPGAKRGGKGHWGHDVAFARDKSGEFDRPEYVRHFFCPSGKAFAINVFPGVVYKVGRSRRNGGWVKIKHGLKHMTVHRHLARIDVKKGQELAEAERIGIVGHAPSAGKNGGFNHNHFEGWDMTLPGRESSRAAHAIDMSAWLKHWRKV